MHKDLSRSQKVMGGHSCRLCWTRRRVCCGKKEVRGEREDGRKGGKMPGGAFSGRTGGEEKGRYAQTGGEEGDIWADFSAGDQVHWRWATGRRPDGASRDGGEGRRRGWLWPGRGCICESKQAWFPNTPRVDVRSVLLVVGFCNDGGCHVACDTVTENVTRRNRILPPSRKATRTHTLPYTAPQRNVHTHEGICDYMYQTPPRLNVAAFVRLVCVPIYWSDPDPRFEIIPSPDYPSPSPLRVICQFLRLSTAPFHRGRPLLRSLSLSPVPTPPRLAAQHVASSSRIASPRSSIG